MRATRWFFGALVLVSLWSFAPTLWVPYLHIDEASWSAMAPDVLQQTYYRNSTDHKPPLLLQLYSAMSLGGTESWFLHLLLSLWMAATAWCLYRYLRRWFSEEAARVSALVFALASGFGTWGSFNAERLVLLPLIAALLSIEKASEALPQSRKKAASYWFALGALTASMALIKIPAIVFGLPFLVLVYRRKEAIALKTAMGVLGFLVAASASIALTGIPLQELWAEAVYPNFQYASFVSTHETFRNKWGNGIWMIFVCYLPLTLWIAVQTTRQFLGKHLLAVASKPSRSLCLGWALMIAGFVYLVCIGGRFHQHYFIILLLPLAAWVGALNDRRNRWIVLSGLFAIGLLLHSIVFWKASQDLNKNWDAQVKEVVAEIKKDTRADDLIWVNHSIYAIYTESRRRSAVKYIWFNHALGYVEMCQAAETELRDQMDNPNYLRVLSDLDRNKPAVIFWAQREKNSCTDRLKLENFPEIEKRIEENYIAKFNSSLGTYYLRKDRSDPTLLKD